MSKIVDPQLRSRERKRLMHDVRNSEPYCWLCGNPIDTRIPSRHPLSSTVDEILPRSRGGSATTRENCRHAHWTCNSTRGNKYPVTDTIRRQCKAAWARHATNPSTSRRW